MRIASSLACLLHASIVFARRSRESVDHASLSALSWSSPNNTKALKQVLFAFNPVVRSEAAVHTRRWHRTISSLPRTRCCGEIREHNPTMQVEWSGEGTADWVTVLPKGCRSCEEVYFENVKEREEAQIINMRKMNSENRTQLFKDIWQFALALNGTGGLLSKPDMDVRRFILKSGSQLSPLMAKAYRETVERVPYENGSWQICAPEQAIALRTLASMVQPRECLDIGSFTGLSCAAVLEALPHDAQITSIELNRNFSLLAKENLEGRNVEIVNGNATDTLQNFEHAGRTFDFVVIDADYHMHETYFNASIRLLRPGGVVVVFGMLFAPEVEELAQMLPKDGRINTVMLPLGCGLQVVVKTEGLARDRSLTSSEKLERKKWRLDTEAAAIDRYLAEIDNPDTLRTEMLEGPFADPRPAF